MDDTAGSRTESAESHPRDSDSPSKAVDREAIPIQEDDNLQQSTPDGDRPKRRIAIGTQRTDSGQTETTARYTYITSKTPSTSSDAPSETSDAFSSTTEDEKNTRPKKTKEHRRGKPDRGSKASAFTDSIPHQKRVNVPNLRQDLDEDLHDLHVPHG